jgi:hypothetical protein
LFQHTLSADETQNNNGSANNRRVSEHEPLLRKLEF